jgi:Holliday junction DNA helicase RuvA
VIARLKGTVDAIDGDSAVIDVNGVGYLVTCSGRTLRDLVVGGPATLLVETIVREDAIALYGFLATTERDWFRILTTVQGVGARVALSILTTLSPDEIARAIAAQDKGTLSRPAGVGPKLAVRLATELKDKAAQFGIAPVSAAAAAADAPAGGAGSVNEDAVSALVNLGYKRVEAFGAVARVTQRLGEGASLNDVIKAGLQELSR